MEATAPTSGPVCRACGGRTIRGLQFLLDALGYPVHAGYGRWPGAEALEGGGAADGLSLRTPMARTSAFRDTSRWWESGRAGH